MTAFKDTSSTSGNDTPKGKTLRTSHCNNDEESYDHQHLDDTIVKTLIFDVDDTLYDVGCGFSDHRNFEGAPGFMMDCLGFPDYETAKEVRNKYFARYHSTAKALTVAREEGVFTAPYEPADFDEYLATKLKFSMLESQRKPKLIQDLQDCTLNIVAFSNGPRKYVIRVLQELGLWGNVFRDETLFAVNDVLPYCKPEREAFEHIFKAVGVKSANECVMIEDSMKNTKRAKELGLKTVLILGARSTEKQTHDGGTTSNSTGMNDDDRYDAPVCDDPSVDVAIETIDDLRNALPTLWDTPARFVPANNKSGTKTARK